MSPQELRDKFFTATVTVNEEGFQKDQADKCVAIAEKYAKDNAIDFFKWNNKMVFEYSSRRDYTEKELEEITNFELATIEERYNLFIKSIETK